MRRWRAERNKRSNGNLETVLDPPWFGAIGTGADEPWDEVGVWGGLPSGVVVALVSGCDDPNAGVVVGLVVGFDAPCGNADGGKSEVLMER